jgi:hypothetical protein
MFACGVNLFVKSGSAQCITPLHHRSSGPSHRIISYAIHPTNNIFFKHRDRRVALQRPCSCQISVNTFHQTPRGHPQFIASDGTSAPHHRNNSSMRLNTTRLNRHSHELNSAHPSFVFADGFIRSLRGLIRWSPKSSPRATHADSAACRRLRTGSSFKAIQRPQSQSTITSAPATSQKPSVSPTLNRDKAAPALAPANDKLIA